MFCINLDSVDPFFNLALEEILLKNRTDDFLILGINSPSVIIGKHQSAHRESDTRFTEINKIPVIRRISGGGTVFHDEGNLNFTFITQSIPGRQIDFRKHTSPVIDYLDTLGVRAVFEGKNDLKVDGLKISGNAEHVFRTRVLHHGTLLFNSSLGILRNAIRKDTSHYNTRAVASNPSPVMNLSDIVKQFTDILQLRSGLMEHILDTMPDAKPYELCLPDIESANLLAESKYKTWEWNYAYGPEYRFFTTFTTDGISYSVDMAVKNGIIEECFIKGPGILQTASRKLEGCRHMADDILKVLNGNGIVFSIQDVYMFF